MTVRTDDSICAEFINYLSIHKPPKLDVVDSFCLFFADRSMANYNWNGISNLQFPKRAMKTYYIFTHCMLAAWSEQGISLEILTNKLKRVVEKINNRRNVQLSKRRRREKLSALAKSR